MKTKLSYAQKIAATLTAAKIPANVIAIILALGKNNLTEIIFGNKLDELKKINGVADKRATIICATLKKCIANVRQSTKADKREKAPGYSLRSFEAEELWRDIIDLANAIKAYKPGRGDDPDDYLKLQKATAQLKELNEKLAQMKFTVRKIRGRIVRLNKSALSEVVRIDYEDKNPTSKLAVIEHNIQSVFDFSPRLFSNDVAIGQQMKDDYQKAIERRLMVEGVRVLYSDNTHVIYGGYASSSSHQKQEKILMVASKELREHAEFFWYGKSIRQFTAETQMTGAERWKATANIIRPWMKPFKTLDGKVLRMKDILFVKDVKKVYVIKNGRRIGKLGDGTLVKDGEMEEEVILGDGAILALVELAFQGQCSDLGLKGCMCDATSSIARLCKKLGMTIAEFMNLEVEGIDGKMHRIGDYKAIAGEGCWKLDKAFSSFDQYMAWLDDMAKRYPGIDELHLLRQAEEIEDEEKVRRLTKTLIQQWMVMSPDEIRKLTKSARYDLTKQKSFEGSLRKLAALWKAPEDRAAVEQLFFTAPWLVMNPCIQNYLEESWNRKLIESASCKFRTEGQYPYIMQDPVALLEVWLGLKDANDPTIGVLKVGEVSVADVPEGKELLCVRFPANFLTAKVMVNRACREAFASMNSFMVLSVHDDILIRQDGDVDGDEMCVIYNKIAIELTKRMNEMFNPPVILFAHGGKPARHNYADHNEFLADCADALWRAKRYDSVGLYANLAMKCAYLAAIAYARGDKKMVDRYLLWMSVASTGAILAIDQVKGNDVDESLIKWLDDIQKSVRKALRNIAAEMGFSKDDQYMKVNPFTHYYNELAKHRAISMDSCLPACEDNYVDQVASLILRDAGTWDKYNAQGVKWNSDAAESALLYHVAPVSVKYGKVTKEMTELLGNNWFKFAAKAGEVDATLETRKKFVNVGTEIGMKEFMLLLWRNEASMAYSMEGRALWEKKEEYYDVCRQLIRMFLESGDWVNKYATSYPVGYEFSMEERWQFAVNAVIKDALELNLGLNKDGTPKANDVEKKGSYALFCMKVFALDLLNNVLKNGYDKHRFYTADETPEMEDIAANIEFEKAEETMELFDTAPVSEDEPEEAPFDYDQIPPEEPFEIDVNDLPEC